MNILESVKTYFANVSHVVLHTLHIFSSLNSYGKTRFSLRLLQAFVTKEMCPLVSDLGSQHVTFHIHKFFQISYLISHFYKSSSISILLLQKKRTHWRIKLLGFSSKYNKTARSNSSFLPFLLVFLHKFLFLLVFYLFLIWYFTMEFFALQYLSYIYSFFLFFIYNFIMSYFSFLME